MILHNCWYVYAPGTCVPTLASCLCGMVGLVTDALAYGKSVEELAGENVPEDLRPHKTFPGTRPARDIEEEKEKKEEPP